jgi:hypothetical protein
MTTAVLLVALAALAACKGGDDDSMTPPATDPDARLRAIGIGPVSIMRGAGGEIVALHGRLSIPSVFTDDPEGAAIDFFTEFGDLFGIDDPIADLMLDRREDEEPGLGGASAWLTYRRVENGYGVVGATIVIRILDGAITSVLANVPRDLAVAESATVTGADAEATVLASVAGAIASSELVILNEALFEGRQGPSLLAWEVRVRAGFDEESRFVDATEGTLLEFRLGHGGNALDRVIYAVSGGCPAGEDCLAWLERTATEVLAESGPVGGMTPSPDAMAAYAALERIYVFFADNFGLDGFDGIGGTVRVYTGVAGEIARVVLVDGEPRIVLGEGNAVLDLIAHEFVHLVFEALGIERAEGSDAAELIEAVADVLTVFLGDGDPWTIGEESAAGVLRSLSNPAIKHIDDRLESLDVHANSGPWAYAFYLLAMGSPADGIAGIGLEKARQILFTLVDRFMSSAMSAAQMVNALWLTTLELITAIEHALTFEDCGSILNALSMVGLGVPDRDNDCFPDSIDTCPDTYNPEQLSTTALTCRLPIASCRIAEGLCINEVSEDPAIRDGCELGGGEYLDLLCTDEGADSACIVPVSDGVRVEVYYDMPEDNEARLLAAKQCFLRPGIYLPVYQLP